MVKNQPPFHHSEMRKAHTAANFPFRASEPGKYQKLSNNPTVINPPTSPQNPEPRRLQPFSPPSHRTGLTRLVRYDSFKEQRFWGVKYSCIPLCKIMEATLHDLGRILLYGLPTFFLVIVLNFYLRFAFFTPLEQILAKRYELTEGARKAASAALNSADARVADYQATLRAARAEVYEGQEKLSRDLETKQAEALQKARANADIMLRGAIADINREADAVRQELFVQSEILADQIANSLLVGKAA